MSEGTAREKGGKGNLPPDSRSCTIVQIAICWKVVSELSKNLTKYPCKPPSGSDHTFENAV